MKDRTRQTSLPGFGAPSLGTEVPSPQASAGGPQQGTEAPSPQASPPESLAGRTVWVIDAHSLIHQVFHALPEMTSPRGEPVGAVYGFTRDLLYLLEEKKPDYLICAFDLPGKTFRHSMYEEYKIQRAEMPDDLAPQFPAIRRVIAALGIPALDCESYEADDVLATVARRTDQLGGQCFLVTGDKDCRQLISERVKVYNIRKNEIYDEEKLREDWGILPAQVVDFQALVGDSVDNVPGVPLIGPKFARQLLQQYGTLEAVLDHAAEVSGAKRKENLSKYRDQALLSRDLVRLDDDVPLSIDWNAGRAGNIDLEAALALFREFGFRGIGKKLTALARGLAASSDEGLAASAASELEPAAEAAGPRTNLVDTPEAFEAFLDLLRKQSCISIDTETTSVRPRWAKLVGVSIAWNNDEAWYLPLRTPEGEPHLDTDETLAALKPILEDPAVAKIGQNLKYDMIVLRAAGIRLAGVAMDTMVASYLLEAGRRNHNLDELAQTYLNHETIKISELIGSGKNQKRMDEVPVRRVADYAGEDAWLPLQLRPILAEKLGEAELDGLLQSLELPLIDVLADMEYCGIKVDAARLRELSLRYGRRMEELEKEIHREAGREVNIASPKQLQTLLFDELKLPVVKRTAKTGPSTDAEVLEELAPLHPLPAKILQYRQYAKLKNTYVDALPEMICPETGRVHASFHQAVTATGRLSSSDPNLQNIPVRTEEGREIRSAFVAGQEGWVLLAADYSQIELRVLAHFSGDARLAEAFARDEDIHARVAGQVNGVPLEDVTPEMRRAAKAVNFGVIYGQSPFGLARALGIDQDEAAKFIDSYFEGYPGIEEFLSRVLADCRKNGYVKTILGRRRAIGGVREGAGRQRNLAERAAVNTVIQGSAADLIKRAMIAIHRRLRTERLSARMLLQIHDELILEVPTDQFHHLAALVREEMIGAWALNVPLKVDLKAGPNWADTEGVDSG
ncbi:MAG: DNA polymerase I [Planctomycetes bacterium]|nr:DNA polymerase I [Planctomycetota bacterium]MBU4397758.1 DNA polymerase I [Planctomycetota bacterium]MCG2682580.1 DNA polymerase I [Planctomycetales bacterium]